MLSIREVPVGVCLRMLRLIIRCHRPDCVMRWCERAERGIFVLAATLHDGNIWCGAYHNL